MPRWRTRTRKEYGTDIPTIRVTFNISQNGLPLETQTQTLTPVTINPNNKGRLCQSALARRPGDCTPNDKANLHIFGVDENNPSSHGESLTVMAPAVAKS